MVFSATNRLWVPDVFTLPPCCLQSLCWFVLLLILWFGMLPSTACKFLFLFLLRVMRDLFFTFVLYLWLLTDQLFNYGLFAMNDLTDLLIMSSWWNPFQQWVSFNLFCVCLPTSFVSAWLGGYSSCYYTQRRIKKRTDLFWCVCADWWNQQWVSLWAPCMYSDSEEILFICVQKTELAFFVFFHLWSKWAVGELLCHLHHVFY